MVKIRENMDLNVLEKYGFEYNSSSGFYERRIDNKWWNIICVNEDREIFKMRKDISYWVPIFSDEEWFDTKNIDDLIKADLVVKVEE